MKQLYEMHGQGRSIRSIARLLGISRNTVRKYLRAPEVPKSKPRAYHKYLVTTWKYTPDAGWTKVSEQEQSYWWESSPPVATWGRYAYYWPILGRYPDVWDARVDYSRVLSASNPGGLTGTFAGSDNTLRLYDRAADSMRGALYNLYNIHLCDSLYYPVNLRPAVANLSAPSPEVATSPVRVRAGTTAPVWQQDCTASVRVARNPSEDPNTALSAILSAAQQGLAGTEAVFYYGWLNAGGRWVWAEQRFVLDPDIPCGTAADAANNTQPVEWIKGFGSVNYLPYNWGMPAVLGTPASEWSRYSYFHMYYIALPGDLYLNQAANARSWVVKPLSFDWSTYYPFVDPWPVRYWGPAYYRDGTWWYGWVVQN